MSTDYAKGKHRDGNKSYTSGRKRQGSEKKYYIFPNLSKFEETLGYSFKDKHLLETALTHTSFTNEQKARQCIAVSNERLEFLGDSVLSLVASNYIYNLFSKGDEGDLTKIRAEIVCEDSLYGFALAIDLGKNIFLGNGEANAGGRNKKSILADGFEALIGAIHIDGGFDAASKFVMRFVKASIDSIVKDGAIKDYKTLLQQFVQVDTQEKLSYALKEVSGPAHKRRFEVNAMLGSNVIGTGMGDSKRGAEQEAAKNALSLFGYKR